VLHEPVATPFGWLFESETLSSNSVTIARLGELESEAGTCPVSALHGQVTDANVKSSFDSANPSVTLTEALSSADKNGTSQE
jgi:hypothetical protein